MGFIYDNILNWVRREVQESSASLSEQVDFAYLMDEAIDAVLDELAVAARVMGHELRVRDVRADCDGGDHLGHDLPGGASVGGIWRYLRRYKED